MIRYIILHWILKQLDAPDAYMFLWYLGFGLLFTEFALRVIVSWFKRT